jgi:hypothetical protein
MAELNFDTIAVIVVVFSILGAMVLGFLSQGRRKFTHHKERTVTLLLSLVAFVALTCLLIIDSGSYDAWKVLPPYIAIMVGAVVWFVQHRRRARLNIITNLFISMACMGLWGVIVYSEGIPTKKWMLGCTSIVFMHVFFYELWIHDIWSKYDSVK